MEIYVFKSFYYFSLVILEADIHHCRRRLGQFSRLSRCTVDTSGTLTVGTVQQYYRLIDGQRRVAPLKKFLDPESSPQN